MAENGNQTFICSVLFLDIVGYPKQTVAVQISLKERFVSYLAAAISDVPQADRIILDAGDGAAINFLGGVDAALKAALSLRSSVFQDADATVPLLLRMGINLGPVRLIRESDGQPNIVGDGINVAQRIMGFSEPGQILVSRSYFEAASRISAHHAKMFDYQGSRTDMHVREHEIYALRASDGNLLPEQAQSSDTAVHPDENLISHFKHAEPIQRVIYIGVGTVFVLLCITLLVKLF